MASSSSTSTPAHSPARSRCSTAGACPYCGDTDAATKHVVVNVRIPRRLDDQSRRLLEELDTQIDESSYDEDEGFFDRLKAAFR